MLIRLIGISLSAAALFACGSADIGAGPCDGEDASASCGGACVDDGDCDMGFYCSVDGMCTADCTAPDGDECPDGQVCTANGRCVDEGEVADAGADASACPSVSLDLDPIIPTVVFLIDQSGSMSDSFDNTDRWNAVRDALIAPNTGIVRTLQDTVRFGVSLYTETDGGDAPCPEVTSEPFDLNNFSDIETLMLANNPLSDTPTGESIDVLVGEMMANPPPADSPPIIIVATDGEPDTCAQPNPQNGQPEAVAAAQNAFANGIELFILSVGDEVGADHLQDMANAGVGLPVDGPTNAPFFVANNEQQLTDALTGIITGVRSCEIDLAGNIDTNRAGEGIVTFNGRTLVFGVDWDVVDGNTIVLLEPTCTEFLEAPEVDLDAEFPCGVVVL